MVLPVAHSSFDLPSLDAAVLRELVLLEFDDPTRSWLQWGSWLDSRGLGRARPKSMLRFNQYDQAVHAALAGHGVALGRYALIASMLAEGRLHPVGGEAPGDTPLAYWLVCNPRRPSRRNGGLMVHYC